MSAAPRILLVTEDFVEPRLVELGFGDAVVCSLRSPAKESSNEDAALLIALDEGRGVLAVADGVGGLPGGQHASSSALEALRGAILEHVAAGVALREAILSGLDRANAAVVGLGSGGATTLAVVEVDGGVVRTYNVGDSGVLVFGGRGQLKLQTIAHSPVGYAVEAGLLDEEAAMVHEDRHIVSNVVGDPAMHVGMRSGPPLKPRDTLVVASDGLFDNLSTDEVVETLRRGSLEAAVTELVTQVRERMVDGGKPDDLTLVAFRPRST